MERGFVTRHELAGLLRVSVRTVDEMVAAKEITPVRLHGPLVRFYMPDVIRELTAWAVARLEKLKGGL
jgi:excisionase family DNA binding protein